MTDFSPAHFRPATTDAARAAPFIVSTVTAPVRPWFPKSLGFRIGKNTVHTSRTMMLAEFSLLMDCVDSTGNPADYLAAVVEQNVLGKATQATRLKTAQRLIELYALDSGQPLFRAARRFWTDAPSRPLLAFLSATARDPLLREMTPYLFSIPVGTKIDSKEIAKHLAVKYPDRFGPTTLRSTSQNLASSWTQAGFLAGKLNKSRVAPVVTPVAAAFAIFLGYLCGSRGKLLLDTPWTRLLGRSAADLIDLATEASKRGWLNYKAAGAVVEITFPGMVTAQEEKTTHEPD